jgi:hypothetical protein
MMVADGAVKRLCTELSRPARAARQSGFSERALPEPKVSFPRSYEAGEEAFLFFAKVLMFEELVDVVDGLYKQHAGNWRETTRQRVGEYLNQYLLATRREYFNKDSYEAAGIPDGFERAQGALASAATQQRHAEATKRIRQWLTPIGARLKEEPSR